MTEVVSPSRAGSTVQRMLRDGDGDVLYKEMVNDRGYRILKVTLGHGTEKEFK